MLKRQCIARLMFCLVFMYFFVFTLNSVKHTIVSKIVFPWGDRDCRKGKAPAHIHWAVQFAEITRNVSKQSPE